MESPDRKKLKELHHGICTDSTGACSRSYVHARGIDWAFTQWYSLKMMPGGGGGGPRSTDLEVKCGNVYQGHPITEGFCGSCGSALAFSNPKPSLGHCPKCSRLYNDSDLGRNFCPECGEPIAINDTNRTAAGRHRELTELLNLLPRLKESGYVASHYTAE
jgi:hypothetical protein